MERSKFLKVLGSGAVLACTGCLASCSSKSDPTPTNVNFTLDLSLPENAALATVGGSLSKSGVILARLSTTAFAAVSIACTHEGTSVTYQTAQQNFFCPNHGSKFDKSGTVLNGPASKALQKYNTELTGNSLRVFS